MSKLSKFYNHSGTDNHGRTLKDIWAWSDDDLESVHDYIQWLFPLKEKSRYNVRAPLLTDADIGKIDKDSVRHSFLVMCDFYGIEYRGVTVSKHPMTWSHKSQNWFTPGNHNFLRLTRIIKSLMLFGLKSEANTLELFLVDLYNRHATTIGEKTLEHWKAAIK